jgi:LacI family transcriptional regulator
MFFFDIIKPVSETGFIFSHTFIGLSLKQMTRPTIADVARLAGVSKSTVSRVLNENVHYMRPQTRDRVAQAITALGYNPSSVARSLISKRTHAVGLLVSDVSNPFYPDVIHGVEDVAIARGYDVFLCNTNYDVERGIAYARSLVAKQVDGVLIMTSNVSDEWMQDLVRCQVPVVILDWDTRGIPGSAMRSILIDYETGIQAAVDHLLSLGHTRLAHVSGPLRYPTSRQRRDSFLHALSSRGIDPAGVTIIEGNLRIDGGSAAMHKIMAMPNRPTAVFCANDLMAMGMIWSSAEWGLTIPDDLSVVGLDDISLAGEIYPPLTTVSLPRYEIGCLAMKMLLEVQNNPDIMLEMVDRHRTVQSGFANRKTTTVPCVS